MNNFFSFFSIFIISFFYCQNNKCLLKIEYDISTVKTDGNIKILVKNIGNEKTKIIKDFSSYKVQMLNILIYSKNLDKYIPMNVGTADIDFFFPEKTQKIKPKETKSYTINIFETFQGNKYLNNKNSYHFDLNFDFISLVDYKKQCDVIENNRLYDLKYDPN